jgi:hypothetical protein
MYGPRATIHATGFENLRAEDGAFDLVIGDVPFANRHVFVRTCAR